jgi:hypothetical protein
MKQTYILSYANARRKAQEAVQQAPDGWVVSLSPPKRSSDQNALMWVLLGCLADQVQWYNQKLTPENWKDVLTAALKKQDVVPGIEGGFVVLGTSTRRMTKPEMAQLIDLIYAFGAEQGVDFGEAPFEVDEEDRHRVSGQAMHELQC